MAPQRDVRLDPVLQAGELELLQPGGLHARERLGELGQRRAAPQLQRLAQLLRRGRGRTACECGPARLPEGGEAVEVERAGLDLQRVAGGPRQQRVRGQQLAQLRHVDVDHLHRRAGHVVSPQVVDELVDGDGPAGLEQQPGQQRALAPATQGHRCAVFAHLERTEDPELHVAARS